jgi:hypothetical protein
MMELNPFVLLGVKSADSKKVILQAIARKMHDKSLDLKTIAECQKILFDPEKSAAARFLYSIDELGILDLIPENENKYKP